MSKFLKVTAGQLVKNKCSLILINQIRQNLSSLYGGTTTSGGLSIPHYTTQRINMTKVKIESGDTITDEQGVKIKCKVIKNRLAKGNPYKTCHYYAIYGQGIDAVSELGTVLVREGILYRSGAWLKFLDENENILTVVDDYGNRIDGKWNGMKAFTNFIRENSHAREFFENIINEKILTGNTGVAISMEEVIEIEEQNRKIEEINEKIEEMVEKDDSKKKKNSDKEVAVE